jgi:hypothetical protein
MTITFFMHFFYQVLLSFPLFATFLLLVDGRVKQNPWKLVALAVELLFMQSIA